MIVWRRPWQRICINWPLMRFVRIGAVSVLVDIGIISAGTTYAAPVIPLFLLHIMAVQQHYLHTSRQLRLLELDTAKALVRQFALKFPRSATANSMGLALLSLTGFSYTISDWFQSLVAMETAFGAASRIKSFCSETPVEKYQNNEGPVPSGWPSRGQIELRNMSSRYR